LAESRTLLKGLDIFCGAGGASAGARAAGVSMVCGIDMCSLATTAYKKNFRDAHVVTKRVERIDLKKLRRRIGRIDILIASPECTSHTCAKGAAPRDEASRATAMQVIRYAKVLKPRWLVIENVIHMRPWSRYEELKKGLERLGYSLAEQVLDASDYGVAQRRKRLFIVGDRKKFPNLAQGKRVGRRKSAKSILDPNGKWRTSPLLCRNRAKGTIARAKRAIAAIGTREPFLLVYYGSDGSGGWQPVSRPLRTITTVDRFALVIPGSSGLEMRMLQVPELKRAMGFSDDFELPIGSRRNRIRLLGNGVCPPVMEAVIRQLIAD
jgi:DNA (cytosine-5)-methyltransferase 1